MLPLKRKKPLRLPRTSAPVDDTPWLLCTMDTQGDLSSLYLLSTNLTPIIILLFWRLVSALYHIFTSLVLSKLLAHSDSFLFGEGQKNLCPSSEQGHRIFWHAPLQHWGPDFKTPFQVGALDYLVQGERSDTDYLGDNFHTFKLLWVFSFLIYYFL